MNSRVRTSTDLVWLVMCFRDCKFLSAEVPPHRCAAFVGSDEVCNFPNVRVHFDYFPLPFPIPGCQARRVFGPEDLRCAHDARIFSDCNNDGFFLR